MHFKHIDCCYNTLLCYLSIQILVISTDVTLEVTISLIVKLTVKC